MKKAAILRKIFISTLYLSTFTSVSYTHLDVYKRQELGGGERKPVEADKTVLAVKGVSMTAGGVKKLDDIDLEVHPGEILGVIGIDGNGQEAVSYTHLKPASTGVGNRKRALRGKASAAPFFAAALWGAPTERF